MSDFVEGNFEDKYGTRNPISRFLMKRFLNTFECYLHKLNQYAQIKTICEVGCGEGELLKIVRQHFPAAEIYACDLSPNEIEKAKKSCEGLDIHFSVQDAQNLFYKDKQFDLVIACEVLEHIPQPEKTISELERISRHAIVSTPIEPMWRILNLVRLKYLSVLGNTPGHLNHWSVMSFNKFLAQSSRIYPSVTKRPYPWQMHFIKFDRKQ